MAQKKARKLLSQLIAIVIVAVIVFACLAIFRVGAPPSITIESALPGIGKRTPVTVTVEESGRGLGDITVEMIQGERRKVLGGRVHEPRPFWAFWGPRATTDVIEVDAGRETFDDLREGEATIRVTARRAPTWIRYPDPAVQEITLPVRLVPPSVEVMSIAVHAAQGGSEAVVYRVGETAVRDGVRAGEWWFPGHPLPGGAERDRFALFAVPYEVGDEGQVRLVAMDDVGNESAAAFITRFFKKPVKTDTIRVSDGFMRKVVPAILSQTPEIEDRGNLLETYLAINGELRAANAQVLVDLAGSSAPSFLWSERFLQMPNTQVMSTFAERRTYLYDGRPVDEQTHLGYDLASTRRASVPAANNGVVVLARYFGIYGNAVVIDHGYGLMTLYGHLSSIAVSEGEEVERGQSVGRSGETGLAGGDHLHYAVLLQGLPVDPVQWWDAHWIRDRLSNKLGPALGFEE
jgi:murein DD-endopeptidase MepM/ murein hydrolase activator NlpD